MSAPKGPAATGGAGDKSGKAWDNFIAKAAGAVIASGIAWSVYKSFPSIQGGAEHVEEPHGTSSSGGENLGSAVDDLGSEAKEKTDEFTSSLEKKGTEYKHKAEDFGSAVARKANSVPKEGKKKVNEAAGKLQGSQNYEIVRGDTLYTISRKYKVSVEVLKDVNGLFGDHIVAGEKLIIPNK